ncbi:AP complex mu/sigma subunit [Penicillium lagena]|uniref:AP complex mu/sigma subunit n=1 Tax=Penicillium lagena TaxID=94218 RepID=UPI002541B5F4|nr:AP complex mu/sigma subunit [Penicillium lagena]KAJ5606361.1 AP complex mu/sigma subunit [Penicillium lagena]
MSGEIDAVYIYDEDNTPLVEHVYRSRPPSAAAILPLYLAHAAPRPSLLYLPNASPPVTVFSTVQSNLLFLALTEVDTEPLLVLEFLHRVVDVLEDFVGAPLLSSRIEANYDVVAQLLTEMCDAGVVCNTEPNALQEVVEVPGTSTPTLGTANPLKQSLAAASSSQGPAIPWRRPGVRHTSNELYVDIIESLSVTMAPSGRLLSALVSGTIAFTAKLSGVPDLLLNLTTPGGQQGIARKIELPVFHPCVRLARWRERPGELSFIPPDGRFILAGYEVDLLPIDSDIDEPPSHMEKLFLPAIVDIRKSLGPSGADFEVRLTLNTDFPGQPSSARPGPARNGSGTSTPSFLGNVGGGGGNGTGPVLEEVVVSVPISTSVRHITDMQASRGDAQFLPGSGLLEWRVPTGREAGTISGTATLRCTVAGYPLADEDLDESPDEDANANLLQGYYEAPTSYHDQDSSTGTKTRSADPTKRKKKKKKSTKKSSRAAAAVTTTISEDTGNGPTEVSTEPPEKLPTPSPDPFKPRTPTPPSQSQSQSHSQSQPQPSLPAFFSPSASARPTPRRTKAQLNASLMPNSASVSFSVRGWLPSGIRVDSLNIDQRRSRGLGESVKPYKGVKYLCVSKRGVERRC